MSQRVTHPHLRLGQPCTVIGCGKPIRARGLCNMHWERWRSHGDPLGGRRFAGSGTICNGYHETNIDGIRVRSHVAIAERAIGHALPPRAIVHHVNRNRSDNRPNNLVVCPDDAYHALLHARMRAVEACGNPDWRKCKYCKKWDAPEKLHSFRGTLKQNVCHQACQAEYYKQARADLPKRGRFKKLTPDKIVEIRAAIAAGESQKTVAERYGIDQSYVSLIASNKTRLRRIAC
jgi:HNH endonuclease